MGEPEDLASAKAVIDELRREKEKCEAEVASVRSKLHGAVRKGKAIEVERTNLAKQLEALKQKLESSVQDGASQTENAGQEELAEENRRLRQELERLTASHKQNESKLAELESAKEAHRAAEGEIKKLKTQHQVGVADALAAQKQEHQAALESISAKHQEELDSQRAEVYKLVTQADAELAAVNQMNSDLQQELQELQEGQAEGNEHVQVLQERVGALEAELSEAFSAGQEAALQNANMASKLDAVWKRCEELEQQVEAQQPAADADQADNEARPNSPSPASNESHTETAADKRVSTLEAELQEARDELAQLQKEAESLQGKLDAASAGKAEELQQLQKQLDAASAGKSEEVQQLRKQLDAQSMELDMARQNADVMREALQSAAAKIQEAQDSEAAAAAKAEGLNEEAAGLRKRVAELEGLLSVQHDLEVELGAAREEVGKAREWGEAAHMQLRAKEVEAAAVAARVKDLEAELAAADEKAAGLVQQAETAAAQAQGEAGGLRAEAERQLAEARAAKEAADEQQKAAAAAEAAAAEAISQAQARVAAAEKAAASLQLEEAARKQRFGLLHSTFAKEKAVLQEQLDSLARESRTQQQSLEQRIQVAQEAEERAASAESEVEDLRRECAEARRQVEELSRKLDSLAADHISAEALEAAVSRAEEAEQSAEELMTQQQALQAELARIKEQLDGSERRLSEAAAELESLKAARTEEQQQQQPNGQAHANGVHTAHGPDGREEVATELAELQEEMMGLQAENAMLLGKVQVADKRVAAATAVQHAKIASLEKSNQELQWQIAMLTRDPEAPPPRPRPQQPQQQNSTREPAGGEVTLPKLVGLILRHRRGLLIGYFAVLHVLLYALLQARGHASTACGVPASSLDVDAFSQDTTAQLRGFR